MQNDEFFLKMKHQFEIKQLRLNYYYNHLKYKVRLIFFLQITILTFEIIKFEYFPENKSLNNDWNNVVS